jgi:hypothetical protein
MCAVGGRGDLLPREDFQDDRQDSRDAAQQEGQAQEERYRSFVLLMLNTAFVRLWRESVLVLTETLSFLVFQFIGVAFVTFTKVYPARVKINPYANPAKMLVRDRPARTQSIAY